MQPRTSTDPSYDDSEPPAISLRAIFDTLWAYRNVIAGTLGAIALLYTIYVAIRYQIAPSQAVTTIGFRIEFEGAEKGTYPNGTRFSPTDLLSTPVLIRVYEDNDLKRYIPFPRFKSMLFVAAANPAIDALDREYGAKFTDAKLGAVERERLEGEFRLKRQSLSNTEFTLSLVDRRNRGHIPPALSQKILSDAVTLWSDQSVKERGALRLNFPLLSRNILDETKLREYDYLVATDILRSKLRRIQRNVSDLMATPGSKVLRVGPRKVSLAEIQLQLNEILRYRLQPLLETVRARGAAKDATGSIRFLRAQLEQNEIEVQEHERRLRIHHDALNTYLQQKPGERAADRDSTDRTSAGGRGLTGDTVIPQFSESFLDRLIQISEQASDLEYRRKLSDNIREESLSAVPLQTEVAYYQTLLASLAGFEARATTNEQVEQSIRQQFQQAFEETVLVVNQVDSIYQLLSQQLNASNVLYSVTSPSSRIVERSLFVSKLLLPGLILMLISVPLVLLGCLLHGRLRSEDEMMTRQTRRVERVNVGEPLVNGTPPHV
ncbi:MAG TPA: hypothetical protein VNM92_15315 [Thermoanaerobaculia bacterium]|nr:hypothetical protein [Thermoanaerobaculia bacterium]